MATPAEIETQLGEAAERLKQVRAAAQNQAAKATPEPADLPRRDIDVAAPVANVASEPKR